MATLDQLGVGYGKFDEDGRLLVLKSELGTVRYRGIGGVPLVADCRLILALRKVAPALARAGVTEIQYSGAYSYRMSRTGRLSLHAYGLALDVHAAVVDGRTRAVERDFQRGLDTCPCAAQPPMNRVACVLREVHLFRELLTPDYDADHRNHLHWGLAPLSSEKPVQVALRSKTQPKTAASAPQRTGLGAASSPQGKPPASNPDSALPTPRARVAPTGKQASHTASAIKQGNQNATPRAKQAWRTASVLQPGVQLAKRAPPLASASDHGAQNASDAESTTAAGSKPSPAAPSAAPSSDTGRTSGAPKSARVSEQPAKATPRDLPKSKTVAPEKPSRVAPAPASGAASTVTEPVRPSPRSDPSPAVVPGGERRVPGAAPPTSPRSPVKPAVTRPPRVDHPRKASVATGNAKKKALLELDRQLSTFDLAASTPQNPEPRANAPAKPTLPRRVIQAARSTRAGQRVEQVRPESPSDGDSGGWR